MMSPLCERVIHALLERGQTLATAESLTGGGIGAALTAVPGASAVYHGGVVSYVNDVKHRILGVSREDLDRVGAVSAPVALAMAKGVRDLIGTDYAISVTGLAGPAGDDFGHVVGTVFVGLAGPAGERVEECHFTGTRQQIRQQTIQAALELLLHCMR